LTIFALGAYHGAWLGSSIAGAVAEHSGWRSSFLVLGIPGLLLAGIVRLTIREPSRGALDGNSARATERDLIPTLQSVARRRSAVHLIAGGSVATLWSWGLMWWTPSFLERSHQLTVGQAGALVGTMHFIGGGAGTLLAGWLMGRQAFANPVHVTRLLCVVVSVSTVISILAYASSSLPLTSLLLWCFVPGVYFYIGPILGLLQNAVPASERATACALLLFFANIGNLVIAPQFVGWLSDWLRSNSHAGSESLRWALIALTPTGFWAAGHLWLSGKWISAPATSHKPGGD